MSLPYNVTEIEPDLSGDGLRIGIALSRFNSEIGEGLLAGCSAELQKLGVAGADVTLVTVPGALELPLALQSMVDGGQFDALIALGCVIRGETYHFEIVANESARGLAHLQREAGLPIANAVLTTENEAQAQARMAEKGADAARVAVEMANLLKALQ